MNLLITICARGGSKGIPGKNIKIINGKPLLHYSIQHAFKLAEEFDLDIQLSTDDDSIKSCAALLGCTTDYTRPDYLATDEVGKIDVIRDAWKVAEVSNNKKYDYVIDLDVSSPLRSIMDIKLALKLLRQNEKALNIFSVNKAARSPYFNMVEVNSNGFAKLVNKGVKIKTRQTAPPVFDMNASFYIFKRKYMKSTYQSSVTEKSLIFIMDHICFDLDEPMDFVIMEFLMKENHLNFCLS